MKTSDTQFAKTPLSISRRGREIQGSPIRKLAALAEARKKQGIHVYHLNIGQPDLPTPLPVLEAVHNFSRRTIEYAPSNGLPESLTAWKKYFNHSGIIFDESELIVTTGGSEAITLAMCAICDMDDEIIVFEPTYANYNGFACIANVKLRAIPTMIENGFHLPSEEVIEAFVTNRTRAILYCSPSNPTGTIYSREEIQRLVNVAIKHGLFILSDETYREFAYEKKAISIADFPQVHDRAIVLESCSKKFNVCGVRIGVLASHNKEIISTTLKFCQARLSVATIEQLAMVPLLENPEPYTQPLVEEFRKRRDVVCEGLKFIPGITFYKPEGAFYITIGLPVQDSEYFAKWLIEEYEDEKETVLLAPAQGFYTTQGKGMNEVRLAFMLNIDDLKRSLIILKNALEVYRRKFLK
ncbi:MAG: pyridoxal phosphate-dependent aminotransferase [Ignavibacteriales bacterium]|nr:pyridoxal phosphate-dependent aminotransferase [Ignavibacteriales bacterium]